MLLNCTWRTDLSPFLTATNGGSSRKKGEKNDIKEYENEWKSSCKPERREWIPAFLPFRFISHLSRQKRGISAFHKRGRQKHNSRSVRENDDGRKWKGIKARPCSRQLLSDLLNTALLAHFWRNPFLQDGSRERSYFCGTASPSLAPAGTGSLKNEHKQARSLVG